MPTPSARATTRHRQAEHTVVRTVSVTAATTACQVTARSPSLNGAAPTCRPRNHSTVTPATRRSNDGPKRRTAGPIPTRTECRNATGLLCPVIRVIQPFGCGSIAGRRPVAVNRRDRGPVVPIRDGADGYGHGGAVRTIQPVDEGTQPTIRLATILGLLATAALLGVVSATA